MTNLTARQAQVLELIKSYLDETGYPPTRAEIAQELGFRSPNAAEEHLKALARKGAIEMVAGASRGIRIPGHQAGLPIVGRVAAGNPILAEENIEEYCEIPAEFFHPPADYLLRVHGMSMKNAGILDGDLIAVQRTDNIRNGQIVVARIEDEVTVKRFKRRGNQAMIQLLPENEDFEVIQVDMRDKNFAIEGLAVGVIRQNTN
ncbi:transcriptional repressor LexA [Microbulbifer bruguierae]|uniref:LexA repressor n=1 Tax=Microbulbifer bruguierae TaxID=3029061 RepID=A0ABY8NEN5_9GAMM|nr:transcriptional repressor LexA [Microbulbifer bruguierae]WGL17263.1 transcriptional repressor LexA [Microbulbifer bruguierae]